jgi:hypothetical protein
VYVANDPLYGGVSFILEYLAGNSSPSYSWNAPASGMTISDVALLDPSVSGETTTYAFGYTEDSSGVATGAGSRAIPGIQTASRSAKASGRPAASPSRRHRA